MISAWRGPESSPSSSRITPLHFPVFSFQVSQWRASQVVLVVKNLPANTGDARDTGSVPEWERSPGEGTGNPLQYSCLENSMDRGAWWAAVSGVAKSQTPLKRLSTHTWCFLIWKFIYLLLSGSLVFSFTILIFVVLLKNCFLFQLLKFPLFSSNIFVIFFFPT